ncbi:MAG: NAD-dependent epimerase/dehydratase family protein [Bacteroidota bacterium]
MKVLVTGGLGFIGSHLVHRLAAEGHEVVSVDNQSILDQVLQSSRRVWVGDAAVHHSIDLTDFESLETLCAKEQFEIVFHLGAKPGVRESLDNPFVYAHSNYIGTLNVFEAAKRAAVSHVVAASSSSVYGRGEVGPFTEEQVTDEPISIYASTKRAGELLAYTYCDLFDMHITNVRFFTVYGPFGRPDMAPWIFTEKISNGEPIKVFDHGRHQRDFTYIDDIIDGVVGAAAHPQGFNILNLGYGQPVALMNFIAAIETVLGREATIEFVDAQPGDVNLTYADTNKAKQLFDYHPKTDITSGMREFIGWYQDYVREVS